MVKDAEIQTIQKQLGEVDHHALEITNLTPGTLVKITAGQFMSQEGVLLDQNAGKAVIQLKEMGIQLTLSLSENQIERLRQNTP